MKEIVNCLDLRGSVPLETHAGIGITHAAPVIDHLDKRFAGIINDKFDLRGPGVNGIFQKLLYGACGPLDYFSGGNLVGNVIW
jgi:hypothetical protein